MKLHSNTALEFDSVLRLLAQCTSSALGRAASLAIEPTADASLIGSEQGRVAAMRRARQCGCILPFDALAQLEEGVTNWRGSKAVLEPLQLRSAASALAEADACQQLLAAELEQAEQLQPLEPLCRALQIDPQVFEPIIESIDEAGEILDEASAELAELRGKLRSTRRALNSTLAEFFDEESHPGYVQEDFITIRGNRLVIPIRIEHRNRHRGIVHDRSRGGDSLFFEPIEAVELNNALAGIHAEIEVEEARVLARLTANLYAAWPEVEAVLGAMTTLDVLNAKARLADMYEGVQPDLADDGVMNIHLARHPLLDERLAGLRLEAAVGPEVPDGEAGAPVVPVDIRLGGRWNVLVITGPNAGGKTVALKTAGVLALMAQAGMQVPAKSYSAPAFRMIGADIGDDQNILSHLSTFSSHLHKLRLFFSSIQTPALILLDEIAAATDPAEGSALAMSVLERLRDLGALVMATTHLESLKAFAHTQEGMHNAAVEFDPETVRPTYQLAYGLPGRSNAMETAREAGLPGEVIERARHYMGDDGAKVSQVVSKLQAELAALRSERQALAADREAVEAARSHYIRRLDESERREQKLLSQIEAQWKRFRKEQEESLAEALAEVKQAASLDGSRQAASRARRQRDESYESLGIGRRRRGRRAEDDGGPLAEGEPVLVVGFGGAQGRILRAWGGDRKQTVAVEIDGKKLSLPREGVRRAGGEEEPSRAGSGQVQVVRPDREARTELNIIGKRVDEALSQTERFLDEALVGRLPFVRIIHGRGSGALRRAVTGYLQEQPFVASWEPAAEPAGGDGVTVVKLVN